MKQVYIVDGNGQYVQLFVKAGFALAHTPGEADLICFTGGSDVSPSLYAEKLHPESFCDMARDVREADIFNMAVDLEIPMVGICRGGQFLNVMSGGRMFQHVTNHCRNHMLTDTRTNKSILVTSTHHQMMRPSPHGVIIATADEWGNKECMPIVADPEKAPIQHLKRELDVEVVFYPDTGCLCFQPHPEFVGSDAYKDMREYFFSLISEFLFDERQEPKICGLVGAAGTLNAKEETAFKQLLMIDALRGNDSTGIASINRLDITKVVKQVGDPASLMEFGPTKAAFSGALKCLIGHNRYATTGKVSKKNAHPFDFDDLVGAHNGTLSNKWKLKDANLYDTDSEALYGQIEAEGVKNTIRIVEGAYALTWYDKLKDTINFLRNKERPLFMVLTKDNKAIFWASEEWMLHGILKRNDIAYNKVIDLPENHHCSYKIPDLGDVFDKAKMQKIEQERAVNFQYAGTSTPITGTNLPAKASYLPSHNYIPAARQVQNMPDFTNYVLRLQVYSSGKSEHGAPYVQLTCVRHPTAIFRVFVKFFSDVAKVLKNPEWIGTVKGIGTSSVIGGYYKVDYSSLKVPEEDESVLVIPPLKKDHTGAIITESEFASKYGQCVWCSQNLEYSSSFRIVSDKDCLCVDCNNDPEVNQYLPNLLN